jgi:hypothetical protein
MKVAKIYNLITIAPIFILSVFGGSLFGQSCPALWQNTLTNNSSSYAVSIGKQNLICDESTSIGSALEFTANYSLSSLTQVSNPIFKITYDGATLLEVKFDNRKITVNRSVQWKECTAWSGGNCTTYATPVFGIMPFSTWDDQFIESTTGWISIKLADNGLWIKTSKSASSSAGPYKSDFSYGGLHLSGIEEKLKTGTAVNFTYSLESSATSGVTLTNITFKAGGLPYIQAVTVAGSTDSPETNYPHSGSLTAPGEESVALATRVKQPGNFKIYPNPTSETLTLDLESLVEEVVEVTLYDAVGRALLTEKHAVSKGFNRIQLEQLKSRGVASGAYLLKVTSNTFSNSEMVIVK